jgi:hypothetical protein
LPVAAEACLEIVRFKCKKKEAYVQTSVCAGGSFHVMYNINLHSVVSFKILKDLIQ